LNIYNIGHYRYRGNSRVNGGHGGGSHKLCRVVEHEVEGGDAGGQQDDEPHELERDLRLRVEVLPAV